MTCVPASNGQSGAEPSSALDALTLFEVEDFAVGQPNGEIASGALSLVDVDRNVTLAWEAQRAGVSSYAIGVNGLRYVADITNSAFNSGAFVNAAFIRLQLATLFNAFPEVDSTCTICMETYWDLLTTTGLGGSAAVVWGLTGSPSNSNPRMRGAARGLRVGVPVAFGKMDGAEGSNYTTVPGNTGDTLAVLIAPGASGSAGFSNIRGALANDWPQLRNQVHAAGNTSGTTTTYTSDENNYLAIGNWSGGVTATYISQLRSLRIRAWR